MYILYVQVQMHYTHTVAHMHNIMLKSVKCRAVNGHC